MSAPEGNSDFCFPESLNVSRDEVQPEVCYIGTNVFYTKILFHFENVLPCSYGWKM